MDSPSSNVRSKLVIDTLASPTQILTIPKKRSGRVWMNWYHMPPAWYSWSPSAAPDVPRAGTEASVLVSTNVFHGDLLGQAMVVQRRPVGNRGGLDQRHGDLELVAPARRPAPWRTGHRDRDAGM